MIEITLFNALIFLSILAAIVYISLVIYAAVKKSDIGSSTSDPKLEDKYKAQVKLLSNKYNPFATGKRPVSDLLSKPNVMPEWQQCLPTSTLAHHE